MRAIGICLLVLCCVVFSAIPSAAQLTAKCSPECYGPKFGEDELANTTLGPNGNTVSYRFRAQHSGSLQAIHVYLMPPGHPGYAAGTGGQIRVTVNTDDGTSAHNPSTTVLSSYLLANYLDANPSPIFPVFTFSIQPSLVAGDLYHVVFTNVDPSPSSNFLSVNALYLDQPTTPQQPTISDVDSALLLRTNGSGWQSRKGYLPILELDYGDGWQEGIGYMEVWIGAPQTISGSDNGVREQFTVSGAQRNVASIALRVARISGSDPLTILLKNGDGSIVEQGDIPASAFPSSSSHTWVSYPFVSAHTLVPGNKYYLELATASSSSYQAFPIRKGNSYNFSHATYFTDGYAQFKQSGDWTGWTQWGATNRTDGDLQFYFEVTGRDTSSNSSNSPSNPSSNPPVISNLASGSIGSSGALVSWTTDQPASGQVQYGTTTAYAGSTTLNPTLATGHAQQLSGLVAGTLYHYRVVSTNGSGDQAISGDSTFSTLTVSSSPAVSGSIALVQQKVTTYSSAASVTVTLNTAPRPGSALVLYSANNSVSVTGVSGGGTSWVRGSSGGSHSAIDLWYGLNSSGVGTAITVTYSNATGSGGINISEFSGVAIASALDVAPAAITGAGTTPATPTAATTNANDLILAAAADTSVAATTGGPTNSFIALAEAANSNKIIPAYRIVSAAGSYGTNWTEGNGGWDAVIVALKAGGSTPSVSLSSITFTANSLTGGDASTGTVTLSGAAPFGGLSVSLASSDMSAAQVPASVTVAAGATTATFTVTTSVVSGSTSVMITGDYNGTTTATLSIVPPTPSVSLSSIALNGGSAIGRNSVTGTGMVTLSSAAPSGGAIVSLTSSNTSLAQVPTSVTVPAGATGATFTMSNRGVTIVTLVTITANYNGAKTATLTLNPRAVSGSIALVQQKVAAYNSAASVTVTLNSTPRPGSALVLYSANSSVSVKGASGGGVSWVRGSSGGSHSGIDIWYGLNSSGVGTAITVTYSKAGGSGGINVSEFSGVAAANALDVAPPATAGVGTTPATPTAATTNANDLILAAAAETSAAAITGGPTNSFIALTQAANSNKIVPAYRIVNATGSYSTSWTGANDGWDAAIVALKSR